MQSWVNTPISYVHMTRLVWQTSPNMLLLALWGMWQSISTCAICIGVDDVMVICYSDLRDSMRSVAIRDRGSRHR